jgi:ribosomal protein L37E
MLGGLLAKAASLRNQKPTKRCNRCGLRYSYEDNEKCPHCGSLSDSELRELKKKIETEQAANRRLGVWFALAAIIILALMLVFSM